MSCCSTTTYMPALNLHLFWVILEMVAFELDELIKAEFAQRLSLA